jgi:hypothetical protein
MAKIGAQRRDVRRARTGRSVARPRLEARSLANPASWPSVDRLAMEPVSLDKRCLRDWTWKRFGLMRNRLALYNLAQETRSRLLPMSCRRLSRLQQAPAWTPLPLWLMMDQSMELARPPPALARKS